MFDVTAYPKAIAAALVSAASYLIGVIPEAGGFGDVSTVQWLGLIVFIGAGYGIVYNAPYKRAEPNERGVIDQGLAFMIFVIVSLLLLLLLGFNVIEPGK